MNEFSFSVPQNITVGKGSPLQSFPRLLRSQAVHMHFLCPDRIGEDGTCGEGGKFFEICRDFR